MEIVEIILKSVWMVAVIALAYRSGIFIARESFKKELMEKYRREKAADAKDIEMLRKNGVEAVDLSLRDE